MTDELLSIERYADVLAHLQHFGRPHAVEVRGRLGVADGLWDASQAHWIDALYADTGHDTPSLAIGFGQRFEAMRRTLADQQPSLDSLGPWHEQPRADELDDTAPSAPAAPQAGDGLALPASPRVPMIEPAPVGALAAVLERPSARAASPWAAVPPPVRVSMAPFAPPLATSTDETALVDVVSVGDPLPFSREPRSDTRAALARSAAERTDATGKTSEVPAILADANATLPFAAIASLSDDDALARLTLEQYASLCAELASDAGRHEPTIRRYGVDGRTWARMTCAWERKFARDPQEKRRFDDLFARYRAWLADKR